MSIANGLKFIFSTSRGVRKVFSRSCRVGKRFGFISTKQVKRIRHYAGILREYGIKGTFFIPAKVLERHIEEIRKIGADNIEWGIHGYVHTDFSGLTLETQREHIRKAIEAFDRQGILFKGFRAPYLRLNGDSEKAIAASGRFIYNSSVSIIWDEVYGENNGAFKWLGNFCRPLFHSLAASLPDAGSNVMQIPVSLPDDDILLDRENWSAEAVLILWRKILRICSQKNEIFVLQLHPERIYELESALRGLIDEARKSTPAVWITTLGELAHWQKENPRKKGICPEGFRGAFCITGDIDSLSIADFILRLQEW